MKAAPQTAEWARIDWPRHAHPSMLAGPIVRIYFSLDDGTHEEVAVVPRRLLIHFSCLARTALSKDKQDETYTKLTIPQRSADGRSVKKILNWMVSQATVNHARDNPLRWDEQNDDFDSAILLAHTSHTLNIPRVLNETFMQLHAHISDTPLTARQIQLIWNGFGPADPLTWRMAHQTVFLWHYGRLGDWDAVESYVEKNEELLEIFVARSDAIMERLGLRLVVERRESAGRYLYQHR
jgi:hypothetical protein